MSEEINNQQTTVTIPGLTAADAAYADMVIPVARGTGDYGLTVTQLQAYMQNALSPITEEERQKLQDLKNAPTDWSGTQSEYNALTSYDAGRWYFIVNDDAVIALYRGGSLVWAVPNCVGQFSDDSTPDDWYWWPNGVKTALPVDPVTKRFSFYYPDVLQTAAYLFAGGSSTNAMVNGTLIRLERIPLIAKFSNALCGLKACETYPVIDCSEVAPVYGAYYDMNYVILNSKLPRDIYFRNTEKITQFEMAINNGETSSTPTRVWGLDFSRVQALKNRAFGIATCIIQGVNLGKRQELSVANLYAVYWGNDTVQSGSRQSVVDTLLANSFDRATAGYSPVTLQLSEQTVAALTADEIAAITAKGYTITSHSTPPIIN